jgi:hypothetical protein
MASLRSSPAPWELILEELAEPQYVPIPDDLCFSASPQWDDANHGLQAESIFAKPFSFSNSGTLRALCRDLTEKLTTFEDEGVVYEDEGLSYVTQASEAGSSPHGSAVSSPAAPLIASPTALEAVAPSTPPQTPRQVLPSASPMREAIETSLASIMDSPTPWHPTALRFEALSA